MGRSTGTHTDRHKGADTHGHTDIDLDTDTDTQTDAQRHTDMDAHRLRQTDIVLAGAGTHTDTAGHIATHGHSDTHKWTQDGHMDSNVNAH